MGFVGNISEAYSEGDKKPIFFLVGGYGDGKVRCKNYPDTKKAVATMQASGLTNVHFLDLTLDGVVMPQNWTGCANHPSWIRNDMIAAAALPQVRAALGWGEDDTALNGLIV